jgi:outer membrane protein assembly factor BamB
MVKRFLVVCVFFLLVISSLGSLSFGNKLNISNDNIIVKNHSVIDYNGSVFSTVTPSTINMYNNEQIPTLNKNTNNNVFSNVFVEGPWPMYCHDARHTSQSPYSTAGNLGVEKWRFDTIVDCFGSPIIDDQEIIYIGGLEGLFAVYPNGTMKWHIWPIVIVSAPAIDDTGILYFGGIWEEYLYAVYSDNGTEKWRYPIGYTWASPTVGPDGIIYAPATDNWNVLAFYSNGTLKWRFHANERVFSSPAIADDGTVYCTSYGSYLYALYPDNGTVKWQYNTGGSVRTSPCIADDGTVYVVSVNGVLHALYPNGTLKWQADYIDGGTSPTSGKDGTIYCGYHKLFAINPDGSLKWVFDPGNIGSIKEGTPCNSLDGTIYFGTYASSGGDLIAVNPNGTERWRIHLASGYIMSAPAIGSDGTVYVGSVNDGTSPYSYGYLHAINALDPDAPSAPVIDGPTWGRIKKTYKFTFNSISPLGRDVYYYIDWGDRSGTKWAGPYASGEEAVIPHSYLWYINRNYTIKAQAKDSENLWGPCNTFEIKISISRNRVIYDSLFLSFLELFPNAFQILRFVIRGW